MRYPPTEIVTGQLPLWDFCIPLVAFVSTGNHDILLHNSRSLRGGNVPVQLPKQWRIIQSPSLNDLCWVCVYCASRDHWGADILYSGFWPLTGFFDSGFFDVPFTRPPKGKIRYCWLPDLPGGYPRAETASCFTKRQNSLYSGKDLILMLCFQIRSHSALSEWKTISWSVTAPSVNSNNFKPVSFTFQTCSRAICV